MATSTTAEEINRHVIIFYDVKRSEKFRRDLAAPKEQHENDRTYHGKDEDNRS